MAGPSFLAFVPTISSKSTLSLPHTTAPNAWLVVGLTAENQSDSRRLLEVASKHHKWIRYQLLSNIQESCCLGDWLTMDKHVLTTTKSCLTIKPWVLTTSYDMISVPWNQQLACRVEHPCWSSTAVCPYQAGVFRPNKGTESSDLLTPKLFTWKGNKYQASLNMVAAILCRLQAFKVLLLENGILALLSFFECTNSQGLKQCPKNELKSTVRLAWHLATVKLWRALGENGGTMSR